MTNSNDPTRSLYRSLAFPLLLCCLGIGAVVLLERISRDNGNWFGQPRSDFRNIPQEWIAYQQTSVFACPVDGQATCFALLDDSTFVIGSADPPSLSFFDENGTPLRKIDLPEEPRAVVCGTLATIFSGKIIVAHPTHIAVYTAEGCHELSLRLLWIGANLVFRKEIEPFHPGGAMLGFDPVGYDFRSLVVTPDYLFVAETLGRRIYRFDAKGNHDLAFGEGSQGGPWAEFAWLGNAFGGFVVYASPITMTFSPKNNLLYITNPGKHRVEVFTQGGDYQPELCWGEPSGNLSGFVGCCNPIGLAALDDGRVLTVEKSVSRIKIFADGKLDCVVAGPGVLDHPPPGAKRQQAEPGGHYFSAVPLSEGRIAVFDFDRQVIRIFHAVVQQR